MTRRLSSSALTLLVTVAFVVACGGSPAAPAPASKPAEPASSSSASAPASKPAAQPDKPAAPAAQPSQPAKAAAPYSEKPTTKTKLTFVYPSDSLVYAAVFIANAKGYLADEGFELEMIKTGGGAKVISALVGGSAQLGITEYGDVFGAAEQKQPVLGFAATTIESPQAIVVKKKMLQERGVDASSPLDKKLAALKGMKIAITTPGSGTDSVARFALRKANLDPERDATIVNSGSAPNILAAFINGQVDAFSQVSPTIELGVARGDGVVFIDTRAGELADLRGRISFAVMATKDYAEKNPEIVARFTKAIWRSLKLIHENLADAKETVRPLLLGEGMDQKLYDEMWSTNLKTFPKTPEMGNKEVMINRDFRDVVIGKKSDTPYDLVATNKPYDAAKLALGY
ncbi:MAG: ABC transporter substrate-binding protein [Chloroflexi bacterium]|nr:ABC transporter substrate-binding protein [Chloroflexota bacterium]